MNYILRAIEVIAILGIIALAVWMGVIQRFRHPDWTETELFLRNWHLALCIFGCVVIGGAAYMARDDREQRAKRK